MMLHGAEPAELHATRSMDHVGDDALESFDSSAAEVIAAFEESDALARTVHHPAGDRSGLDLLWQRVAEWTIHAWDLARAIGGDERLDPDLVDTLSVRLEEHGTGLDSGGYYAPAKGVPSDDSAQSRLLVRVGRHP
jgi:uncharacterized protein (TIGR03086 family)